MPTDDYIKRSDALNAMIQWFMNNRHGHMVWLDKTIADIPAADVEPKCRWVSVTDIENLPKKSTPCLVACNQWGGEIVRKAMFLASENCFTERGIDITEYVTHWMESPKPPQEEKDVQE